MPSSHFFKHSLCARYHSARGPGWEGNKGTLNISETCFEWKYWLTQKLKNRRYQSMNVSVTLSREPPTHCGASLQYSENYWTELNPCPLESRESLCFHCKKPLSSYPVSFSPTDARRAETWPAAAHPPPTCPLHCHSVCLLSSTARHHQAGAYSICFHLLPFVLCPVFPAICCILTPNTVSTKSQWPPVIGLMIFTSADKIKSQFLRLGLLCSLQSWSEVLFPSLVTLMWTALL